MESESKSLLELEEPPSYESLKEKTWAVEKATGLGKEDLTRANPRRPAVDLPSELLIEIVAYHYDPSSATATKSGHRLRASAQVILVIIGVCKAWAAVGRALLYGQIPYGVIRDGNSARLLARTLQHASNLASFITSLDVQAPEIIFNANLNVSYTKGARSSIPRFFSSRKHGSDTKSSTPSSMLADWQKLFSIILRYCPNIRDISIRPNCRPLENKSIESGTEVTSATPWCVSWDKSAIARLRRLTLQGRASMVLIGLAIQYGTVDLPALEHLTIHSIAGYYRLYSDAGVADRNRWSGLRNLRSLGLCDITNISHSAFCALLKRVASTLEELKLDRVSIDGETGENRVAEPIRWPSLPRLRSLLLRRVTKISPQTRNIHGLLSHVASTLEELTLLEMQIGFPADFTAHSEVTTEVTWPVLLQLRALVLDGRCNDNAKDDTDTYFFVTTALSSSRILPRRGVGAGLRYLHWTSGEGSAARLPELLRHLAPSLHTLVLSEWKFDPSVVEILILQLTNLRTLALHCSPATNSLFLGSASDPNFDMIGLPPNLVELHLSHYRSDSVKAVATDGALNRTLLPLVDDILQQAAQYPGLRKVHVWLDVELDSEDMALADAKVKQRVKERQQFRTAVTVILRSMLDEDRYALPLAPREAGRTLWRPL